MFSPENKKNAILIATIEITAIVAAVLPLAEEAVVLRLEGLDSPHLGQTD
jgi:hypothetical protein